MTGDGLLVTLLAAAPAASARLVSRGEGLAPSTRKPTTLTGGEALESAAFFMPGDAERDKGGGDAPGRSLLQNC